jgi:PAS domain S-box-containing protein
MKSHAVELISAIPDGLVYVDLKGVIRLINPALLHITGYRAKDLPGRSISVLLPDENFSNEDQAAGADDAHNLRALITGEKESWRSERCLTHKDGHPIWVEAKAVPVRSAEGKITGLAILIADISERKQTEETEHRARLAAEEATRAKSAFLASMSHEIRTPLHGVSGMISLLLETPLTSEQQEFVNIINVSSETLLTIINNVLDFSKIEAGRLELESKTFDLRSTIEETLDLMASQAAEKKLELAYFMSAQVPEIVVGDVTRLAQILVNLLSNAVKFTDQGQVVVEVAAESVGGPAAESENYINGSEVLLTTIHFAVRDTGIGIPRDRIERLFKSFSQADISTTRKYGGTGLGLVISKEFCELMGGKMWVESEGVPGKGSAFHFTIVVEQGMGEHTSLQYIDQPHLMGKRLLVIDDTSINRMIISHFTDIWGMTPRATSLTHEAMQWVHRGDPFDVVLLDMQMPGVDSLALAGEIHRSCSELPLVMLTSLSTHDRQIPSDLFAARINKPIKLVQLYDTLTAVLTNQPTQVKRPVRKPAFDSEMAQKNPMRILLAEDNHINQRVVLLMLAKLGYQADVASSGVEVLEKFKEHDYDVIFMDVQMPEMDGEEATRCIRSDLPQKRQPYIIALTADALEGRREFYLSAGMDDVLTKPMGVDNLVNALSHYWSLRQLAASSARSPAVIEVEVLVGSAIQRSTVNEWIRAIGNPAAFRDVLDDFLRDSPPLFEQMDLALAARDWKALKDKVHMLRSSSGHMGAVRLANLLGDLESASGLSAGAAEPDTTGLQKQLDQIQEEYHKACAELYLLRQELGGE